MYQFLLVMGAAVAFSAGSSQVGLAVGPLVPLTDGVAIPTVAVDVGAVSTCSSDRGRGVGYGAMLLA